MSLTSMTRNASDFFDPGDFERGLCGVVKLTLLQSSTYDQYQHNEKLFVWKLHPFW
eukprot:COSAG01_NODE_55738_length_323_cov_0.674107_1_plen_55_part_01